MSWWSSRKDTTSDKSNREAGSALGLDRKHFTDPRNLVPVIVLTTASIGSYKLYRSLLRRIPQAKDIPQNYWRRRSLKGFVTRVGDGDGFHLYHTPGGRLAGWGWLRHVPTKPKDLKDQTIQIRNAGIDAPEVAHFGRPDQPGGKEALEWLQNYLLHRHVSVKPWRRDQYDRAVGTVYTWKLLIRRDVGIEMLKRGLATVYEAKSGAEYGGKEDKYRKVEAKAKSKGVGIWARKGWLFNRKETNIETPMEFKKRTSTQEKGASKNI